MQKVKFLTFNYFGIFINNIERVSILGDHKLPSDVFLGDCLSVIFSLRDLDHAYV